MVKHLACIMDGNRRWAKKYGWLPWDGHKEGINSAIRAMDFCLEQQIPYLSLYTFSLENFNRPLDEQNFLFSVLLPQMKDRAVKDLVEKKVRLRFVGDRSLFPASALPSIHHMEKITKDGDRLQVNLLFCYGGRQEIMAGVKKIIEKAQKDAVALNGITDEQFEKMLWTAGIPAPEIIIRTGGVKRLSNFLLFQAAYSEFYFLDCFWPELTKDHLKEVIDSFGDRQQNFGK